MDIECEEGQTVNIITANFGRTVSCFLYKRPRILLLKVPFPELELFSFSCTQFYDKLLVIVSGWNLNLLENFEFFQKPDSEVCPYLNNKGQAKAHNNDYQTCSNSEGSLAIMQEKCQGKQECSVSILKGTAIKMNHERKGKNSEFSPKTDAVKNGYLSHYYLYYPHPKDVKGTVFTDVCVCLQRVPQSQVLSLVSGPRSFLGGTPVQARGTTERIGVPPVGRVHPTWDWGTPRDITA